MSPTKSIRIPEPLHFNLRRMAADKGTPIATEVEEAIAVRLAEHRKLMRTAKARRTK